MGWGGEEGGGGCDGGSMEVDQVTGKHVLRVQILQISSWTILLSNFNRITKIIMGPTNMGLPCG